MSSHGVSPYTAAPVSLVCIDQSVVTRPSHPPPPFFFSSPPLALFNFSPRSAGAPVDQQRLVFAGQQLEDARTLGELKVGTDAVLALVYKLGA